MKKSIIVYIEFLIRKLEKKNHIILFYLFYLFKIYFLNKQITTKKKKKIKHNLNKKIMAQKT